MPVSGYTINVERGRLRSLVTAYAIAALATAVVLDSRSFMVGIVAALGFCWSRTAPPATRPVMRWLPALLPVIAFFSLTFLYKTDSSAGRALIYKIAAGIWQDHFLRGVGWSNFANTYMDYQERYFRAGHYTTAEMLLAGNVRFVFNDYYQWILEGGLMGCLLIAVYVCLVYYVLHLSAHQPTAAAQIATFNMIAISIAALFTHVWELWWVQLTAVGSLGYLLSHTKQLPRGSMKIATTAACLLILYTHFGRYLLHYNAYQKAAEARVLLRQEFYEESATLCAPLYTTLKQEESFLNTWSQALLYTGNYPASERITRELICLHNTYIYQMRLAETLQQQQRYQEAEAALQKAIYMVPNRFLPRFQLFNLYLATAQQQKADSVGDAILQLPVKIPSPVVTSIKEQTRKGISKNIQQ